ncbi:transporter substrate-binding domain-containing protein [Lacimicrobium sp. SS2-24]|uniref:substrate-binding periplasmic protein n=1 Tax=Lacimicrobium sp. SS2-24 TaxID=2005569 RepID=UPI0014396B02|nr:transporter substrate-binding domain-containing protein [Lacimicrobium sp. SS2-24]
MLSHVLLLLVCSLSAHGAQLRAVTEHFPPFSFKTENGYDGFSIAFFKQVAERLDMELKVEMMPWARAYHIASTQPDTLIFSMARTAERETQFLWLEPFASNQVSLFGRKSQHYPGFKQWTDAQFYRVGVIRDSATAHIMTSHDAFSTRNNLVEVENIAQLTGLLELDRVDVISLSESMLHQLQEHEIRLLQHLVTFDELTFYGAFHPDSDPQLVEGVASAMRNFLGTEAYQNLVLRYFPNKQGYATHTPEQH